MPAISPVPMRTPLVGEGGIAALGWEKFFEELRRAVSDVELLAAVADDPREDYLPPVQGPY
jgi:hypothetical protein